MPTKLVAWISCKFKLVTNKLYVEFIMDKICFAVFKKQITEQFCSQFIYLFIYLKLLFTPRVECNIWNTSQLKYNKLYYKSNLI